MDTEQPAFVAPPSLRHLFPFTKAPRNFTPSQVGPFIEALVAVLNKKLPARLEVIKDGPYKLTIHVDVDLPALPASDASGEPPKSAVGG